MMKYLVIKPFTDMQDNNYRYQAGDEFPRKGLEVSASRIKELASDKNRRGVAVIEAVPEPIVKEAPVEAKAEKPAKEVRNEPKRKSKNVK